MSFLITALSFWNMKLEVDISNHNRKAYDLVLCLIWSGSAAASEGIYIFIFISSPWWLLTVSVLMSVDLLCSMSEYNKKKMCQKNDHVSCAHRLIWWATSEGIYDFIPDIKFMTVSDCAGVVPYLSPTRRDVLKEWSYLTCSQLLVSTIGSYIGVFCSHGSSYWWLPEDFSGRSGLKLSKILSIK